MQSSLVASSALVLVIVSGPLRAETSAPISIPEDHSLTVGEYVERGLPELSKEWGAEETARAARMMAELANEDLTRLPRYGSSRSGEVFERVLAESVTFGGLGSGAPSASLECYAFDPQVGMLFDRELIAIRRASAEANLRVVHESVAARQEVDEWVADAEREGGTVAAGRLRGLGTSQDRIQQSYAGRLLIAIEGLVEICEIEDASAAARAQARADALRLLEEAEPVMTPAAAESGQALRRRLQAAPGCGAAGSSDS